VPQVKKAWIVRDSEEEMVGNLKSPVKENFSKAKSVPVTGKSDGNGVWVGSGVPGTGVMSEEMILELRALDMARNLRRVVRQNVEFREELLKVRNTQLDLLGNLCGSLQEISYQLHLHNAILEKAQEENQSEVLQSIQQVVRLGEGTEVGVQVEVAEEPENAENAGNVEVTEDVGTGNVGGEDEMMKEA
jgi:hypothetical protein